MKTEAPSFTIGDIQLFERPVTLRLPFRFGVVTLTHAPQAYARLRISLPDGRSAWGAAAELMAPKWFDKNPALSNEQNFDQLRRSLLNAVNAYSADPTPRTAFGHSAAHHAALVRHGAGEGLNALVVSYGPALLDRAVIDALCRLRGMPFVALLGKNQFGIEAATLTPDLAGFDLEAWLAGLSASRSIAARHTVGLIDPLRDSDVAVPRLNDGLPESLQGAVAQYGHRWFKLKVGGNVESDLRRLQGIAAVLDESSELYRASLDGNEQYDDVDGIAALWAAMKDDRMLRRLISSILYIEQPIKRASALAQPVSKLAAEIPLIVDESDADYDVFPAARALGYRGISSKTCKGVYRAILNAARCHSWGDGYFITGEDLTCQAGLAVQQDLTLVAALGLSDVERNGHHYVDGFGTAPQAEQDAFLAAHPDLYHRDARSGRVRLNIRNGNLDLRSTMDATAFGSEAEPDWGNLSPLTLNA
jgi:L-alanine-DL-glutamate epimerase-like enolase superfamily enzyme